MGGALANALPMAKRNEPRQLVTAGRYFMVNLEEVRTAPRATTQAVTNVRNGERGAAKGHGTPCS